MEGDRQKGTKGTYKGDISRRGVSPERVCPLYLSKFLQKLQSEIEDVRMQDTL
jgi:hypothetical protein